MCTIKKLGIAMLALMIACCYQQVQAQTSNDAIMMNKGQFCNGITYSYSQWTDYWEGELKRNNQNMGMVTTQSLMYMPNYGITNNLNVMAAVPYVWTHASGGTMHGMSGFQDLSLDVKWKPLTTRVGPGKFSLFLVGGFSTPLSNYSVDFLPMSIGLGTTNLMGRVIINYGLGIFFFRASGAYVWRSNTKLDRTSYYTTSLHLTNEVQMPDVANFNGSLGIHKKYLIAEAMLDYMKTLGGFDIRRNDNPFPSNKMNSLDVAVHVKYTLPFFTHVSLDGIGSYVVAGRNVGQATSFMIGAFYVFDLFKKGNVLPQPIPSNR
jgi:hypothetical protein